MPGAPDARIPLARSHDTRQTGAGESRDADMWGNIYPRSGFVSQTEMTKRQPWLPSGWRTSSPAPGTSRLSASAGPKKRWLLATGAVEEYTGTRNHKWQRLTPSVLHPAPCFRMAAMPRRRTVMRFCPVASLQLLQKAGPEISGSTNF